MIIAELPDNTAALATDLAAVVPGHVGKTKTTCYWARKRPWRL